MTRTEIAIEEVRRAGLCDKDSDYDGMIGEALIKLIETHGRQGHSGASHQLTVNLFKRVMDGRPLSPLTNDPEEWVFHDHGPGYKTYQNKRCSNVFTEDLDSGTAYTIDGAVFRDGDGSGGAFTGPASRVEFAIPGYPPETVYINEDDWRASEELQEKYPEAFDPKDQ